MLQMLQRLLIFQLRMDLTMCKEKTFKEVLTIKVEITAVDEVLGRGKVVRMIHFGGSVDCDNFKGIILPGGVDTQKDFEGESFKLSARYILEGEDREGKKCRIFVENNGEGFDPNGENYTMPTIVTDSEALAYLENANLKGTIEPWGKGVIIHILSCD